MSDYSSDNKKPKLRDFVKKMGEGARERTHGTTDEERKKKKKNGFMSKLALMLGGSKSEAKTKD